MKRTPEYIVLAVVLVLCFCLGRVFEIRYGQAKDRTQWRFPIPTNEKHQWRFEVYRDGTPVFADQFTLEPK